MAYKFGERSLNNLKGVHPKMVELMLVAIKTSPIDFSISEGVRTAERQNELFKQKRSQRDGYKKKSEHQVKNDGFGYAVDIYPVDYNRNKKLFDDLSLHIKATAKKLGIKIVWGGDWKSLVDKPHYELAK